MDFCKSFQVTEDFRKKYFVPDVFGSQDKGEIKVLFILESPHIMEVKHGYPAAGRSGINMAKIMMNGRRREPLGKLIHDGELKAFGIKNICNIPMQKVAYDEAAQEAYPALLGSLEKLRLPANIARGRLKDEDENRFVPVVMAWFDETFARVLDEHPNLEFIIPCGKVAQTFFGELVGRWPEGRREDFERRYRVIADVPHPSYNLWDNNAQVDEMVEQIHPYLPKYSPAG